MTDSLTLLRPDDWHVHLREGEMLRAVLPFTSKVFARALVMPNLRAPITTSMRARAYRDEILALLKGESFSPLMALYLTDGTSPDDLEAGFKEKILAAAKLYPANATTNAASGITDIKRIYPVLSRIEKIGMPLSIHGEVNDADVDIFDREAVFIDRVLIPLRHDFPALKIVLEHVTTEKSAAYIAEEGKSGKIAATITAHHLHLNRDDVFKGGMHPHYYCLPVAKGEKDRQALIKAATSGGKMFFLGTDSAPHPDLAKGGTAAPAGIFTAPNALGLYAQIFDDAEKLENLEAFASLNGAAFYGLPANSERITLKKAGLQEIKPILTDEGQKITAFASPSPVLWRVA